MHSALQTGQLLLVIWNPVINSKMSFSWQIHGDHRWCQGLLAASPQLLVCNFPQCFVTGFHASTELVSFLECLLLPCPFLLFTSQQKYPFRCNMWSSFAHPRADQVNWIFDLEHIPVPRASQALPQHRELEEGSSAWIWECTTQDVNLLLLFLSKELSEGVWSVLRTGLRKGTGGYRLCSAPQEGFNSHKGRGEQESLGRGGWGAALLIWFVWDFFP